MKMNKAVIKQNILFFILRELKIDAKVTLCPSVCNSSKVSSLLVICLTKPCHLEWGVTGAQQGSVSGWGMLGVMKLEKHVEIVVTARWIQTLPDAQAVRDQGPHQSYSPAGRDSPERRAKRCQMWRKPPGSLTPSPSNTVSIVLQHMLPVKGEKCRHQHMPEVFQA